MENPLVSVRVLTYNQEAYISKALDSILNQKTTFNFEIVVGEDCSFDGTRKIVLDYQNKYPDIITAIFNESNLGIFENFKKITNLLKGKYITGCAGDDWWHNETRLQQQVEFLEKNVEYGMVYSDYDIYYQNKRIFQKDFLKQNKHTYKELSFELLLMGNIIPTQTVMIRRDIFENLINIDVIKHLFLMEDYPFWIEMAKNSKIGYIDSSLATYRHVENSVSHPKSKIKEHLFFKSILHIKDYYIKKYSVCSEIESSVKKKHYEMLLSNAYSFRNKYMGKEALGYFISNKSYHIKFYQWLQFIGSQNLFLWFITKLVNKTINAINKIWL